VVGFITRPMSSSSASPELLLIHFLNVSRRGKGDDAISCALYISASRKIVPQVLARYLGDS
jgi:hypothetical protein